MILFVSSRLFVDTRIILIITDDFHVCCMNRDLKCLCPAKPSWSSSCEALLSNIVLRVACWVKGILIVLINSVSICKIFVCWYTSDKLKEYDRYVMLINFCGLVIGTNLLAIVTKNVTAGDNYIETDIVWRSSFLWPSLWSVVLEGLFLLIVSIARFKRSI